MFKHADGYEFVELAFNLPIIFEHERNVFLQALTLHETGCTLSKEQVEYAADLVKRQGLQKDISIVFEDYRKIEGKFDKFVSIGMFEHVGKQFIPTFMEKVQSILNPGGIGLLHTIGQERPVPGD